MLTNDVPIENWKKIKHWCQCAKSVNKRKINCIWMYLKNKDLLEKEQISLKHNWHKILDLKKKLILIGYCFIIF
jgi:hypothetical protein